MTGRHGSPEERFERYYIPEPNSGCWLWFGAITSAGYGALNVGGQSKSAHIFSYENNIGSVPDGLELDHLCRQRSCVNPDHLEPVTRRENVNRGDLGMPRRMLVTSCAKGHPYDQKNTYWKPNGTRKCLECGKLFMRAWRKKHTVKDMSGEPEDGEVARTNA